MQTLFHPRSVLVLGVSRSRGNMGKNIVNNLISHGFDGEIHLFGAKGGSYSGHRIHDTFDDIPAGIDLAVFLVPARAVPNLLEQCVAKGIRRAVIETGGFSEFGAAGREIEAQIVAIAKREGVRFIGPNCLGIMNLHTGLALPFMTLPPVYRKGDIVLLAQSGGVGTVYLQSFAEANLGLSAFASLGNKLDVNEVDLLRYFDAAPSTKVACLYLEDVKQGRAFYEAAKAFDGPILVQKANTTELGSRIAQTHTASIAVDDEVFEGMCRQANLVRVPDMKTMLNGAMGLSLPPMRGRRLAIVARSGGHAVIAADLAAEQGFELPPLPDSVVAEVQGHTRAGVIQPINPLDLGDLFDFDVYVRLTEELVESGHFDGVAFMHVFASVIEYEQSLGMAHAFRDLVARSGLPIAICFMADGVTLARFKREAGVPVFPSPEETIRAMGLACDHHRRKGEKRRAVDLRPLTNKQVEGARVLVDEIASREGDPTSVDAFRLLAHIGVPVAPWRVARSPAQAGEVAAELGGMVVLKLLSRDISHKSDVGGVVVGLHTPEETTAEAERMQERVARALPGARLDGFLVMHMVRGIREALVGVRQDPTFGPIVVTGFGGIYTELFRDVAIRLAPISDVDAADMINEVVAFKAFRPWRNHPASDVAFLKDVLARVAHLIAEVPRLQDLEINPLRILKEGQGGWVLDARMVVSK